MRAAFIGTENGFVTFLKTPSAAQVSNFLQIAASRLGTSNFCVTDMGHSWRGQYLQPEQHGVKHSILQEVLPSFPGLQLGLPLTEGPFGLIRLSAADAPAVVRMMWCLGQARLMPVL